MLPRSPHASGSPLVEPVLSSSGNSPRAERNRGIAKTITRQPKSASSTHACSMHFLAHGPSFRLGSHHQEVQKKKFLGIFFFIIKSRNLGPGWWPNGPGSLQKTDSRFIQNPTFEKKAEFAAGRGPDCFQKLRCEPQLGFRMLWNDSGIDSHRFRKWGSILIVLKLVEFNLR